MFKKQIKEFSLETRNQTVGQMQTQNFDLCIIGGGITGAGVARDAASRGMKVCLIEQNDFASGTSSRSSKLIHGGIRYLENLEFGLVFEALNERHILFEIAPHLVHPLSFVLPIYKGARVGMFKMGLGMWLYDALALLHAPKMHERLSAPETVEKLPTLQKQNLVGAYSYSDAYMDDDRLVIETLRSANRFGAQCASYVKAGKGQFDDENRLQTIVAHDLESNKKFEIRAKHFLSTVGPWTDQFASSLFAWTNILRPTKGIHLTFHRTRLPINDAAVMATGKDRRIVFAIPRHEMIIVGTTDTDFSGDPGTVRTEREDVEYLLAIIQSYFPEANLTEADIISSYSGVRPLVADSSQGASATSREHIILPTKQNVTFVAGGKYTTYRRMARDIVEKILKNEFSLEERVQFARNQTREPINPLVTVEKLSESIAQSINWAGEFGLTEIETQTLAERHGFEALEILENSEVKNYSCVWEAEALFAIRHTMCFHLRDFMIRRSPLYLAHADHGLSILDKITKVFQNELGWSDSDIKREKELFLEHLKHELNWQNQGQKPSRHDERPVSSKILV